MSMLKNHGGYRTDDEISLPALRGEAAIRADQRWIVREVLKYTVRGRRGAGLTSPHILRDVRNARRRHSESIAREAGR